MRNNPKVDLSQYHGTNNLLLRRRAKKVMQSIISSEDPVGDIESILQQAAKAYSVSNKYLHIQADVMLRTLYVHLKSNKFDIPEQDSIIFMRRTSAVIGEIVKAKERAAKDKTSDRIGSIKEKFENAASPFIPSPRTILNSIKIQNPMVGAIMDVGENMLSGDPNKKESLFDNDGGASIERMDDADQFETSAQSLELNAAMTDIMAEQLLVMSELLDFTKTVWGEAGDNLENISDNSTEQVERLEDIDEETKRNNYETAERIRESEDDSLSSFGAKKFKEDEDGFDLNMPVIGDAGIGGAIGAVVGVVASKLGKLARFGTKFPVIGTFIAGALSVVDAFDDEKNMEVFGKSDLTDLERGTATAANFVGSIVGLVDMFLGTEFAPVVKKKVFDGLNGVLEGVGETIDNLKEDLEKFNEDPSVTGFAEMFTSGLETLLMAPLRIIDDFFGTDIEGFFHYLDSVIENFFTDTLPKFFTETIPQFFTDLFEEAKEMLVDFVRAYDPTDKIRELTDSLTSNATEFLEDVISWRPWNEESTSNFIPTPHRRSEELKGEDQVNNWINNVTNVQQNNNTTRQDYITRREMRSPTNEEHFLSAYAD